jgi:hypothetical protein
VFGVFRRWSTPDWPVASKFSERFGGFEFEIERDQTPARFVDFSGPELGRLEFDRPGIEEEEQ